jgi:FixJ family two-component response regulator
MNDPDDNLNFVTPMHAPIKVAIVDDDAPMRRALARLMRSAGIEAATFTSADEFLGSAIRQQVDCAVSDLRMPGFDGLRLQQELTRSLPHLSLVLISGYGDIPTSVKALKDGAVDFLVKPVNGNTLLAAVSRAAERSRALKGRTASWRPRVTSPRATATVQTNQAAAFP